MGRANCRTGRRSQIQPRPRVTSDATFVSAACATPRQLATLRSAMRDLQVSIGDYYRCSEGFGVEAEVLATPARSSIGFVWVLNELFRKQTSRTAEYCAIFEPPTDSQAELIQAFEYLRHVTQHIDPVHPQSAATVGGAGLGFRTYATWKEVPSSVHERLTSSTKALKPIYERNLQDHEVVGTLLNAARFFAEVCPDIVHRQANGEWTGFPLRHQAGVSSRLHPEEPDDQVAALAWMARRRPGGDLRVVCGSITDATRGPILFGLTFMDGCAFVPFFETLDQVNDDIAVEVRILRGRRGSQYVGEGTRIRDARKSICPLQRAAGSAVGWRTAERGTAEGGPRDVCTPRFLEHPVVAGGSFRRPVLPDSSGEATQCFVAPSLKYHWPGHETPRSRPDGSDPSSDRMRTLA